MAQLVLVIGSGRTGTNLMGKVLDSHPLITTTFEVQPHFARSQIAAIIKQGRARSIPTVLQGMKEQEKEILTPIHASKLHHVLWYTDKIIGAFPSVKFVALYRNPFATISSMMKHPTVPKMYERYRDRVKAPPAFFGVTQENAKDYSDYPLEVQLSLRWQAHMQKIRSVKDRLGERVHTLHYEDLIQHPEKVQKVLTEFLQLDSPIDYSKFQTRSLIRWQDNLTYRQVLNIHKTLPYVPINGNKLNLADLPEGEPE